MKVCAVALDTFIHERYGEGRTSFTWAAEKLDLPVISASIDPAEFIPSIYDVSKGYDAVALGYTDSSFYCLKENRRLLDQFIRYNADYGFGDDYPQGVVFEWLRRDALPVMENIRKEASIVVTRNVFQDIMHKDVNMFDLENLYAPVSLKALRLSFFSNNRQNQQILETVEKLMDGKKYNDNFFFDDLARLILANRDKMRTIPKYYEIEISTVCSQECTFCPKPKLKSDAAFMSVDDYRAILDKIIAYAHDPVVALTGMGDAASHPEMLSILSYTLSQGVECILETSGAGFTASVSDAILAAATDRLTVIFSIDTVNPELYQQLRSSPIPFSEVLENIEYFLLRRPHHTYVQLVKMKENFEQILPFHKHFSRFTKNIIIQKYNPYKGFLPERRINPMEPFDRIDCWHLKRDMNVKVSGDVVVCKQDIRGEHVLGNLLQNDIATIHAAGQPFFEKHIQGWDFCKGCDEYYTYNF